MYRQKNRLMEKENYVQSLKYGRYIIFQKDRTLLKLLARLYKGDYLFLKISLGFPQKPNLSEPNYTIF